MDFPVKRRVIRQIQCKRPLCLFLAVFLSLYKMMLSESWLYQKGIEAVCHLNFPLLYHQHLAAGKRHVNLAAC